MGDKLHDELCVSIIDKDPNMMVPWYLMASYAYYIEADPILSDGLFDRLAVKLLSKWQELDHFHKHFITEDDLKAGTLLLREYPTRVIRAVYHLRHSGLANL